jgi:chaperonin GroES
MQIKPLGDNIIVKKSVLDNVTQSGLIIPDGDKPDQGIVLAVGRDAKHVKAGDTVVFGKRMGQVIKMDDGEVLLMSETVAIGVL